MLHGCSDRRVPATHHPTAGCGACIIADADEGARELGAEVADSLRDPGIERGLPTRLACCLGDGAARRILRSSTESGIRGSGPPRGCHEQRHRRLVG